MDNRQLITKTLNTFFNPFEWDNILKLRGQSESDAALMHGASLTVGLGAAAALARSLSRKGEGNRENEIRAWSNARYPVMSIDNSLRDSAKEEKIRSAGSRGQIEDLPELNKTSKDDGNKADQSFTQILPSPTKVVGNIAGSNFSVDHPAVALAAAIAGLYGGYKLSDYSKDANRSEELDNKIKQKQNDIDKLVYQEYMRTRGLEKAAVEKKYTYTDFDKSPTITGTMTTEPIRGLRRFFGTGYSMWVLGAASLAYIYSKKYHDKNDPARSREKQLQEVARDRARQTDAPIMLSSGGFQDVSAGSRKVQQAPPKRSAQISTVPSTTNDSFDDLLNP